MPVSIDISIGLCTCNGERFLAEQLSSLAKQSYLPAELVVCDDASEDSTCRILEVFSNTAQFPVRLYRNQRRLGIRQNFEQAIRLCKGSVIALCDQDDVWLPEKLARFAQVFANGADWICCDAEVVDATLSPLGYTLWERVGFNRNQRIRATDGRLFQVLLKHYVVAGATVAFRAELREQLLPIPTHWLYDAWVVAILAGTKKLTMIDECLQFYRQHGHNAIGGERRSFLGDVLSARKVSRRDYLELEFARWQQLAERLESVNAPEWVMLRLAGKLGHLVRRAEYPGSRLLRSPLVFSEITRGGYSRFSRNWGSVALDLFNK
ncbi:MAG: glycosyltransferase family 2 protein [Propionivibrio sp.]|nr:glycosyltransferase family 2 protein [Propionivibrio sp.]